MGKSGEPEEIEADVYGVLEAGGAQLGKLFCDSGSPDLDLWQWNGSAFPAGGFLFTATAKTGALSPTVKYPSYKFSTSKATPSAKWPGNNKTYGLKLNNNLVGWMEVQNGNSPDMMWWSNGQGLSGGRKLIVKVGDVLTFASGVLPGTKQFPLMAIQKPV